MSSKKNILRISLLACILVGILVAGSIFATGTEPTENNLNVIVSVPSEAVKTGETFVATVKISNEDVASFKLAGLQVELTYDSALLTASSVDYTLDTEESTAVSNVNENVVKFVCVKNEFSSEAGYSTLSNLFTITFTAKSDISNPAALFSNEDIYCLMGDVDALKIANSDAIYGADKAKVAEAILNSGLELAVTQVAGTVIVAPTPANTTALTKTDLENALNNSDVVITAESGVIGTGAKITVDGEEAEVVIKGDIDGDGIVTVFDAMMAKKADFDSSAAREFAGDVNNDNATNGSDVSGILSHVVGNSVIG